MSENIRGNIRIFRTESRDWISKIKEVYTNETSSPIIRGDYNETGEIQYIFMTEKSKTTNQTWFKAIPENMMNKIRKQGMFNEEIRDRNNLLIIVKKEREIQNNGNTFIEKKDYVIPFGYWSKLFSEPNFFESNFGIDTLTLIKTINEKLKIKKLDNEDMENGDLRAHSKSAPSADIMQFDNFNGMATSIKMIISDYKKETFKNVGVIRANKRCINFENCLNVEEWIGEVIGKIASLWEKSEHFSEKQKIEWETLKGEEWSTLADPVESQTLNSKVFKKQSEVLFFTSGEKFKMGNSIKMKISRFSYEGTTFQEFEREMQYLGDDWEFAELVNENVNNYKKTYCKAHCVNEIQCDDCDLFNSSIGESILSTSCQKSEHQNNVCVFKNIDILNKIKIFQNTEFAYLQEHLHIEFYSSELEEGKVSILQGGKWKKPMKTYSQILDDNISKINKNINSEEFSDVIWKKRDNEFNFNKSLVSYANAKSNEEFKKRFEESGKRRYAKGIKKDDFYLGDRILIKIDGYGKTEIADIFDIKNKRLIHVKNTICPSEFAHLKNQIGKSIDVLKAIDKQDFYAFLKGENPHYSKLTGTETINYECKKVEGKWETKYIGNGIEKSIGCGIGIKYIDGKLAIKNNFKTICLMISQASFEQGKIPKNMSFYKKKIIVETKKMIEKEGFQFEIILIKHSN